MTNKFDVLHDRVFAGLDKTPSGRERHTRQLAQLVEAANDRTNFSQFLYDDPNMIRAVQELVPPLTIENESYWAEGVASALWDLEAYQQPEQHSLLAILTCALPVIESLPHGYTQLSQIASRSHIELWGRVAGILTSRILVDVGPGDGKYRGTMVEDLEDEQVGAGAFFLATLVDTLTAKNAFPPAAEAENGMFFKNSEWLGSWGAFMRGWFRECGNRLGDDNLVRLLIASITPEVYPESESYPIPAKSTNWALIAAWTQSSSQIDRLRDILPHLVQRATEHFANPSLADPAVFSVVHSIAVGVLNQTPDRQSFLDENLHVIVSSLGEDVSPFDTGRLVATVWRDLKDNFCHEFPIALEADFPKDLDSDLYERVSFDLFTIVCIGMDEFGWKDDIEKGFEFRRGLCDVWGEWTRKLVDDKWEECLLA
ncbi:hypothetical protein BDR26DRAFT_869248 [Obelidium mucronatum]|nr:hypothetical protein BDR26DRAFT_869248 [Obelidium mucronatum]